MIGSERIGVLGLARSGRAAAELALHFGARVFASDAGDSPALREAADAVRRAGGEAELGGHSVQRLAGCDLLVVSPGISPDAEVLREDALRHKPRISELEFAFRHLRAPVIAVTGTNGKTTTTALAAHLLRAAGLDAPAAGNIGLPLSEIVRRGGSPDWVVVEASSYQLGCIERFEPRIGVVTNLSPDHLDRYATVEAYYRDKAQLFRNGTASSSWVLNGDDPEVLRLAGDVPGRRYLFRLGRPASALELGASLNDAGQLLARLEADEFELLRASEFALLGEHNLANALAASLAALLAGAPAAAVSRGLRDFRPLPHRLEPVAAAGGVVWINDSKATNLASARVALRSMTQPTVLLLGGVHKGEPYGGLLPELRGRVRLVLAYGRAAERIVADLGEHVPVRRVRGDFQEVVRQAAAAARPGETVLLSPACSSFDMFRDYEERGLLFSELAREVAAALGSGGATGEVRRSGGDDA